VADRQGLVRYLNPDELPKNPAFTNVVVVSGNVRTIYVGGQDAVDAAGNIVGKNDLAAQVEQILTNLEAALAAAGAGLEHVVKWNIYLVQGQSLLPGLAVFQRRWGNRPNPPAITGVFVAALARPEFLAEIDAVAVVPD
jgi:enamine deaminase RidA (YjgF/YER057c/UK114 family)